VQQRLMLQAHSPAEGTLLQFAVDGQPGSAQIYWRVINQRLVQLFFMLPAKTATKTGICWDLISSYSHSPFNSLLNIKYSLFIFATAWPPDVRRRLCPAATVISCSGCASPRFFHVSY